jgi:hypothetical protein
MRHAAFLILLSFPLLAADWHLFTSFRGNGETGVYFALSADGLKWTPLNGGQPWIKPQHPGMLMRDPFLAQGPDGVWRLLWTWGWTRKETGGVLRMGYAESQDLVNWSPQREIRVMEDEPTARNLWAPEAAWDPERKEWIVFWSTTIPGRFPDTENTGDTGYNHRLYAVRTKNFQDFTKAELWFDPGFNSIDATLVRDGRRWIMVFKDERRNPVEKRLRLAFGDSPAGPWSGVTGPISRDWVEGPSVARIGGEWLIYYDRYTKPQHYGALRTRDWKQFEDITAKLDFPPGHRHGTVAPVPEDLARRLRAQQR